MSIKKTVLLPYHVEYPKLGGSAGPSILVYARCIQDAMSAGEKYAHLFLDEEGPISCSVQEATLSKAFS